MSTNDTAAAETYATTHTDTDDNGHPVYTAVIHYAGRKRTESLLVHSPRILASKLKARGVTDIRPLV